MRLHHKAKDKEETRQLRQAVQKIIQQNLRIVFCRRQRRKKTTLPSSTENNSTESENGILQKTKKNTTSPSSTENNSTESENGILQNHCIDNIKTISKDSSENALLCCLLRQSTYFFCGSPSKHTQLSKLVIRNKLILEEVFCRIIVVILEANSKENSEDALLRSLLQQSTDFFSWLSKQTHSAIKTCNSN